MDLEADIHAAMLGELEADGFVFVAHQIMGHRPYGYDTATKMCEFVQRVADRAGATIDVRAVAPERYIFSTVGDLHSAIVNCAVHGAPPGRGR